MNNKAALSAKSAAAEAAAAGAVQRRIGVDPARTESYRNGYRRLIWLTYILTAGIILLIGALIFTIVNGWPQDRYFAQTSEGAVMQMAGLARPNISQQAMFDWAAESASQIMTFGFNDYNQKLTAARTRFTEDGWESFGPKMSKSAFFRTMIEEQQIATAVPMAPPVLFSEGMMMGRYSWVIEVPMMLTVRSGSVSRSITQQVRMVVIEVPTDINPMGIAIDRWISF